MGCQCWSQTSLPIGKYVPGFEYDITLFVQQKSAVKTVDFTADFCLVVYKVTSQLAGLISITSLQLYVVVALSFLPVVSGKMISLQVSIYFPEYEHEVFLRLQTSV